MADEEPGFALDEANELRRAIGESVRAIRRTETTPDGWIEVLGFLTRDGAHSIAALARRRRVRHQTMRVTVADLEAQGLVQRTPDPDDARGVLVTATERGRAVVAASRLERSTRLLAAMESALDADERATLLSAVPLLDRVVAALHAEADAAG